MSSKRPLNSSEKSKVIGVLDYFKGHSKEGNGTCIQQTVDATGVSRATIFRLQKELKETGKLSSPERPHTRKAYKPIDDFDQTVIRNKIRQFYTHYKMLPTLRSLHAALKTEISYPGGLELLRKALKDMGYKWKKTQDNRTVLIEKPAILSLRYKFYERKHELQENGYSFVFIDETWIDTANSQKRCWQGPGLTGVQPPCNRGQRLVVVHAGSRKGFIPEAKLVYKASSSTGDYHSEMDGKQFTKWLEERLIPNLPDKCAVVMDNASYHSMQTEKCPTSSTRKDDIKVNKLTNKAPAKNESENVVCISRLLHIYDTIIG